MQINNKNIVTNVEKLKWNSWNNDVYIEGISRSSQKECIKTLDVIDNDKVEVNMHMYCLRAIKVVLKRFTNIETLDERFYQKKKKSN